MAINISREAPPPRREPEKNRQQFERPGAKGPSPDRGAAGFSRRPDPAQKSESKPEGLFGGKGRSQGYSTKYLADKLARGSRVGYKTLGERRQMMEKLLKGEGKSIDTGSYTTQHEMKRVLGKLKEEEHRSEGVKRRELRELREGIEKQTGVKGRRGTIF